MVMHRRRFRKTYWWGITTTCTLLVHKTTVLIYLMTEAGIHVFKVSWKSIVWGQKLPGRVIRHDDIMSESCLTKYGKFMFKNSMSVYCQLCFIFRYHIELRKFFQISDLWGYGIENGESAFPEIIYHCHDWRNSDMHKLCICIKKKLSCPWSISSGNEWASCMLDETRDLWWHWYLNVS